MEERVCISRYCCVWFTQILPPDNGLRPRTLVYVSKAFHPLVSLATSSPRDPDLLAIDVIEGNAKIQLINVYNEAEQAGVGPRTLERLSVPPTIIYKHRSFGRLQYTPPIVRFAS